MSDQDVRWEPAPTTITTTIVDETDDSDGEALVDEIIDAYGNLKDTITTPYYGMS
jgi:hypothetical protein